jgi:PEGA domain
MTTCSIARSVGATTRATAFLLATTLSSGLVAPAAFAQEQPQAENVAAARSLGLQGIKLADAGDCKGAIEKLSRAEALYHAPSILGRLGECQVNVGQVVVGTENLNRVVREELAPNAPKAFRDAQTRAKGVLSAALPKIAHLTVKVDPPDAKPQVTVGGTTIPAALLGAERPTDPGTHEVVVSAPGYLEQRSTVTLSDGASQELALKLQKDPNAGEAAPPPAPPAPVVAVPPPAPASDTSPKKNNTLAFVALGVGGAGLLVGGVTGFLALGKKSDLDGCEDKKCPPSQQDTLDSAKNLATVSTVGFAVGFVGVGAGIVLLLTGNNSASANASASRTKPQLARQGVTFEPWFGGNSAGVNGTF